MCTDKAGSRNDVSRQHLADYLHLAQRSIARATPISLRLNLILVEQPGDHRSDGRRRTAECRHSRPSPAIVGERGEMRGALFSERRHPPPASEASAASTRITTEPSPARWNAMEVPSSDALPTLLPFMPKPPPRTIYLLTTSSYWACQEPRSTEKTRQSPGTPLRLCAP